MDERPLLVVAGVDKAGTSTLAAAIRRHPQIDKREWVAGELRPPRHPNPDGTVVLVRFNRLFARPDSTRQVAAFGRETRVAVSFRDPIARVESLYRHRRAMGRLPVELTIDEFVRMQLDGRAPRANDYLIVSEGRFADDVPAWQEAFGDDFRVLLFEEWIGDVPGVIKDLVGWMGLDPPDLSTFGREQTNESGDARFPRVSRAAHLTGRKIETWAGRVGQRDRMRRPVTWATQHLYVRTVQPGGTGARISDAVRAELEDYYRDSNDRLATLLGRPLPWADTSS